MRLLMFPIIVLFHSITINTWGLMVFLAGLCVLWLGRINAPERGIAPDLIERLWPWLILGGFVGAHFYYLAAVTGWPLHRTSAGELCNIFSGTAIQGGILGGACAAWIFMRRKSQSILAVCDVLAPTGALAQALTRIGCFGAGCCYGRRTNLPIGVIFSSPLTDPATPRGIPLHPAQLYEAFLDACLAAFLQGRLKKQRQPGIIFTSYLIGTSLIRFTVEFFRGDDIGRLFCGMAHSQFLAMAMFAAGMTLYVIIRARGIPDEK